MFQYFGIGNSIPCKPSWLSFKFTTLKTQVPRAFFTTKYSYVGNDSNLSFFGSSTLGEP